MAREMSVNTPYSRETTTLFRVVMINPNGVEYMSYGPYTDEGVANGVRTQMLANVNWRSFEGYSARVDATPVQWGPVPCRRCGHV